MFVWWILCDVSKKLRLWSRCGARSLHPPSEHLAVAHPGPPCLTSRFMQRSTPQSAPWTNPSLARWNALTYIYVTRNILLWVDFDIVYLIYLWSMVRHPYNLTCLINMWRPNFGYYPVALEPPGCGSVECSRYNLSPAVA